MFRHHFARLAVSGLAAALLLVGTGSAWAGKGQEIRREIPGPFSGGWIAKVSNAIFFHRYQVTVPLAQLSQGDAKVLTKGFPGSAFLGRSVRFMPGTIKSYPNTENHDAWTSFEVSGRGFAARRLENKLQELYPSQYNHVSSLGWE